MKWQDPPLKTPNCTICHQPLTDNERDWESGYYYTDHHRCSAPNKDGQWISATRRTDDPEGKVTLHGAYLYEEAALRWTHYLAGANYQHKPVIYFVIDPGGCHIHEQRGWLIKKEAAR